ncbi:hypothetical protein K5V07_05275 [Flavobacterium sp. CHNK8]|nr:hypothetical protein [Flavobacterium sp. CHNK8]QZK89930.1 hypothetical protein K5V07_05275 [Flavobacterium sp. CHNK8]
MEVKTHETGKLFFSWLKRATNGSSFYGTRKKDLQYYELQQTAGLGSKKL